MPERSTTGCSSCKARRKKCDETKPRCLRCLASGRPCHYEYVEYPNSDGHRIQRTRLARCATSGPLVPSRNIPALPLELDTASSCMTSVSENLDMPHYIPETCDNGIYPDSYPVAPRGISDSLSPLSTVNPMGSLHGSRDFLQPVIKVSHSHSTATMSSGSISSGVTGLDHDDSDDLEGVRVIMCMTPTMDKNVKENTLPFVLQCYSHWAIARLFEPLKVAHSMRDQIIQQSSSDKTRTRIILLANVMGMYARNFAIDGTGTSILGYLALEVQKSASSFMATPPSFSASDRQSAMHTLNSIHEILAIQINTQPSTACVQLLDCAAPVFRRACLEPPGQPLNLPRILLEPNPNLRHFATIDIMKSVTTGRPTYFQYEVPFSLELCEQMYQMQDIYSLQWLHGFPEQFIMLFAWINSLCETPGASENSELVAWIERQLPQIKIAIDESGDPVLRLGRMVVQECWRFAVLIYLYMALCKASALDPRVIRAQKGFMRLVRGIKPGRNPDAHLVSPMVVAGVATLEERDRDTLRQRIVNLRECAQQGNSWERRYSGA
ncbi:hypothetical protein RSAG8_10133, partial [Rhizoctonia solani AG-8 WAC10335]